MTEFSSDLLLHHKDAYRRAMLEEWAANCEAHEASTADEVRRLLPLSWDAAQKANEAFQAYVLALPPKNEDVILAIAETIEGMAISDGLRGATS